MVLDSPQKPKRYRSTKIGGEVRSLLNVLPKRVFPEHLGIQKVIERYDSRLRAKQTVVRGCVAPAPEADILNIVARKNRKVQGRKSVPRGAKTI